MVDNVAVDKWGNVSCNTQTGNSTFSQMLARCCVTIHDLLKCGSTLSISLQLHTKKPNFYDNEFSINVKILKI